MSNKVWLVFCFIGLCFGSVGIYLMRSYGLSFGQCLRISLLLFIGDVCWNTGRAIRTKYAKSRVLDADEIGE